MANPILDLYAQKRTAQADDRSDAPDELIPEDAEQQNPLMNLYARKKAQKKREVEAKPKVPEELTAPWRAYTAEDAPNAIEELTVPKVLRPGAVKKYRFQQGAETADADGMARMRGDSPEYTGMLANGMSWEEADRALVRQMADPSRDVLADERKARNEGGVVLPSGTVLRREDMKDPNADIGTFFRQVVEPGIEAVENAAEKRYDEGITGRYGQKKLTWGESIKAALRTMPLGGEASAAQLVRQAGEARRERGPARIVQDVLAGIDPEQANAYIADHLKDDPEFAVAAEKFGKAIPEQDSPGLSDEELRQAVASMTPAQRKQYDKRVAEEQQRISAEQDTFGKAAAAAWTRQVEKFQQEITARLVEEMARRNMPKNELEAFARTAYNTSIPGLMMEWAAGNVAGDENKALYAQIMQRAMEKYDPSLVTKIGGEVAGLLLSGPVFSAGGAAGKFGAAGIRKLAERNVMKRLMARGITEGAEGVARRLVAGSTVQQLAQAAVVSGTTLGSYDAVVTPLAMAAVGEGTSAADVLGATGRGFATGMLLPGIGMVAGRSASAATSRLRRYASELGGFAAENAAFVGMGTLYEGLRTGEWGSPEQLAEEFGHSVGVLGIMKSIGALKRGRTKNPGFYDKVLAETEFTPEEVEALGRAGVDGRSYKRAVFDLLNAKEAGGNHEVSEGAAKQISRRYAQIMQSPEVPISAKAKLMYLAEGCIPGRLPLTTEVRRTVGEDGRTTIDLLEPSGNLVQRRTFSSEKAADAFERESIGVREINTIHYYENEFEERRSRLAIDEAAETYAAEKGISVAAVKNETLKAVLGYPHDTAKAESIAKDVIERAKTIRKNYDDIPAMIAEGIALKYNFGEGEFERSLYKHENARTPREREAVAEYAEQLKKFATQERQQASDTPEQRAERQLMQVAGQKIDAAKNRDDEVIYTATMQDGRQANIVKGTNLAFDPETGEIDATQSEPTVVVRYDDGTMRQVSVMEIDMIVEVISADEARVAALQEVRAQLDAAAREEVLSDAVANGSMVELKDGRIGAIETVNENGTFNVAVQDNEGQIVTEEVSVGDITGPVETKQAPEAQRQTAAIPEAQAPASTAKVPIREDGQPDFNAMPSDMLAVELSEIFGHDKAVERLQAARKIHVKEVEKLRKAQDETGDLNKAIDVERRIAVIQQEDARLSGALEQLGAEEVPVAEKSPMENFSQEIDRLFPDGLPDVRTRVLADIARGQRFVWSNSPDGSKRGVAAELGFTGNEAERRARFGLLGTEATGAKHVSRYVHDLWEDSNGYAFDMDDAALRNEVIDVLLFTPSRTAAMEQLRDMAARNTEDTTLPRDAEEAAAMQAYEAQRKSIKSGQDIPAVTEEEYLAWAGYGFDGIGDVALHKGRGNSRRGREEILKHQYQKDVAYTSKREELRAEYRQKIENGELREPSVVENLIKAAQGLEENESVQAARRALQKRGIQWDTNPDEVPFSIREYAAPAPTGVTPERWQVIVEQLRQTVGAENVVTDSEAVKAAYDRIMQRGVDVRRHQVEQVTERFNTQLDLFTKGKLPSGEKIGLGTPGATLLACGISDSDITVTQRVLKDHMDKHRLTADDIKDLPAALEKPVMVYEWGTKSKVTVVITEIARGDERIAVALKLKSGRNGAVVNAMASVHGKSVERLLADMNTPLTDFGTENLKWVDKEKVLDWITAGSSNGSSGTDQGLITATNIVTNFENPKIGPYIIQSENVGFFRTPNGEVFGFTIGGAIYLDGRQMNAETPMHEYTELWSQIVVREQPGLWARGVELMKQTAVWDQVNADPNYKNLPEELRASETLSRIAAGIFDGKQAGITNDDGLFDKLRTWLREMWKSLKATFSKWSKKELEDLTWQQFVKMPLRDFVERVDLQKYHSSNNGVVGFNRVFTEQRMTTLEKLENKRTTLIADRENIANFDEQLAEADAEIEAYRQVDHVAETYGQNGADAESDAHLHAVEDAVYDIVRKEGVEGVQVDVVRSPDAMLEYARNKNWTEQDAEDIASDRFSPGYYGDREITILSSFVRNRKDAEKKFWHERTHGVTDEVCTPEQLVAAAEQAGTELLDRALAEREYTSDRWSLERQADEYVARAVEIIAGKGLLTGYLSAPDAEITPITSYLRERNVPPILAEIIVEDCKFIKNQKYGTHTGVRDERGHRDSANAQGVLPVDARAGGSTDRASEAGYKVGQSSSSSESGVSWTKADGRADGNDRILSGGERSISGNVSERNSAEDVYVDDFDRQQTEGSADTVFADRTSMSENERIADAGHTETGSNRRRFAGDSDANGDAGGIQRNGEVGFQQHLDPAPKLTRQQQLIADLRRAVRNSKASARAVAQIVSRRVREDVGRDLVDVMGKREFDALVRQIEQATARQEIEKPLQRIAGVVLDLEIKRIQAKIDKFLQMKVQGETPRGVSIGKVVDDQTHQVFEIFRDNIGRPGDVVLEELQNRDDLDYFSVLDSTDVLDVYNDTLRYRRDIADIKREQVALYKENTELRKQRIEANRAGNTSGFVALQEEIAGRKELIEALDAEGMQAQEHLVNALKATERFLSDLFGLGRELFTEWHEQQDARRKEIVKVAFGDVGDGKRIPVLEKQPGVWEQGYRRTMDFLLSPAYSMDYLLKMLSVNAPGGEGAMYDHFMRGKDGYVEARGRYYLGYEDFKRVLDEKVREVFGKSYPEVLADSAAPTDAVIRITNGQVKETFSPTIGEALYIYMADKMEDGRVKLRRMGITEEKIDALAALLPQQYVRFADWLQNEFLPQRRKAYNATHLSVFGTQMADIEHYVPLRVAKQYVYREVRGDEPDPDTLPSAITGSIIRRTRNEMALNLHTNALDLMLEHGRQMEHWNAFTRVVLDMNALLSSTAFRRMLDARNPGLHKRLKVAAQLAADTYRPQVNDVNRAWIALGKLAATSKIAFRVNTALKQVLSYPAFYAYSPDPKFWMLLTKNLAPTTWAKNFRWCLDNIPSFHERWLGRMAGNEKLAQMTAPALDKWLDKMNRYGMLPNAFVDALTCANGAMAVYEFRREIYMARGRDEAEAERLARIDAAVAINATQQSGEGMYLGQMQADRDFWSVSLSTFQNSNFAYLRKQLEGINELLRDAKREQDNREEYYKEKGFTETEAFDQALKEVVEAKRGALLNIAVFMFGLNMLWALGNNVWKYLFASDTRDEIPGELAQSALMAPLRNTTVGSIAESWAGGYGANPSVLLSDMVGFYKRLGRIMQQENPDAWNETAAYLTMQTLTANGLGIDLESFVNMYQGIAGMIRDGMDVEDLMRVLNAPQSQAKLIAGTPKEGETEEEYRQRMIFTERRIAGRVNRTRLDKWTRNYTAYRQAEALGMESERDKFGSVTVPELKRLDAEYAAALKISGLTAGGDMRQDYDWPSLTPEQRDRWRQRARLVWQISEAERALDTVVIFNEGYARQMRELMKLKENYIYEVENNK